MLHPPTPFPQFIITLAASHIKISSGGESIRQAAFDTVRNACQKARAQNFRPISAVDDLSMSTSGPWIDDFATGLAEAAILEDVSISGGEMAQMPDTYKSDYIGIVVYVLSIKE